MKSRSEESIAMLLTPPGTAAIAVIRLRGQRVASFLSNHLSRPIPLNHCVHVDVRDDGLVIDDAVAVLSEGGHTLDLSVHGGSWVMRSVLDLAGRSGFQVVPMDQQLHWQAFDGEMLEREILALLPRARTELALRTVTAQRDAWRLAKSRLADLPGHAIAAEINLILVDRALEWLTGLPRVAIVGAANVGKSTLANQLFGQARSITADLPGTTRDWVGEIADINGLAVMLVDTPGLRATSDEIESAAIHQSAAPIQSADLLIRVLDASQPLTPEQAAIAAKSRDGICVINKTDLIPCWNLSLPNAIHIIATAGHGLEALRSSIRATFLGNEFDPMLPRCWTARQRQILRASLPGRSQLADL